MEKETAARLKAAETKERRSVFIFRQKETGERRVMDGTGESKSADC